eukprot:1975031-Pyramimonas_sp.AAC.1
MDYVYASVLSVQMGGVPGRRCDVAVLASRLLFQLSEIHVLSAGALLLDFKNAFYTTLRQLVLSLPQDSEDVEHVLSRIELPPILLEGPETQLATKPMFEDRVPSEHLLALIKESQRDACWRVASASDYT